MTTPEKPSIEKEIVDEIKLRLLKQKRSKKWLAYKLGMDYGRVKRLLSDTNRQPLSLDVADRILTLLGSSLRETISFPIIKSLRKDIEENLKKYDNLT